MDRREAQHNKEESLIAILRAVAQELCTPLSRIDWNLVEEIHINCTGSPYEVLLFTDRPCFDEAISNKRFIATAYRAEAIWMDSRYEVALSNDAECECHDVSAEVALSNLLCELDYAWKSGKSVSVTVTRKTKAPEHVGQEILRPRPVETNESNVQVGDIFSDRGMFFRVTQCTRASILVQRLRSKIVEGQPNTGFSYFVVPEIDQPYTGPFGKPMRKFLQRDSDGVFFRYHASWARPWNGLPVEQYGD